MNNIFGDAVHHCEECGAELLQEYGSGNNEYGEFADYECFECGALTRFYEEV